MYHVAVLVYELAISVLQLYCYINAMYIRIVKLREREGQRVNLGRSLKGHL